MSYIPLVLSGKKRCTRFKFPSYVINNSFISPTLINHPNIFRWKLSLMKVFIFWYFSWPSSLGESQMWDSNIWSWVPRVSYPKMTALTRPAAICKWQTRLPVREGAPRQQTRNCLTVSEIWSWARDGAWHQDKTGRQTVGRNVNLSLKLVSI
jgi:hypothetical protein